VVSVILNIAVVRQVLGFLCVTLLPGFAILNILKLKRNNVTETLLFSVGLSIVFATIVGLISNEVLPFFGYSKPLSEPSLVLIINGAFVLLYSAVLLVNRHTDFSLHVHFGITSQDFAQILPFLTLIPLSVVGSILVDAYKINSPIIVMMIAIVVLFIAASFQKFGSKIYPVALLAISAALVFQRSLISNYINGVDIHSEYYVLATTLNRFRWIPMSFPGDITFMYSSFNSMLSDTVFPTICAVLLGMDPTWILKIAFPLIYCLVPVGLYEFHRATAGKHLAFVATFFFMTNFDVFLQPTSNAKQMIAELFYVLLFIMLMKRDTNSSTKLLCLFLFSFGLVTSHYATSYIFLILVAGTWLYGYVSKQNRKITLAFIVLFFTVAFSWYIYTSTSGPFDKITSMANHVYSNLFTEFVSVKSRGTEVESAIVGTAPSVLHDISRGLFFVTVFFIFLGFLALVLNRLGRNFGQEYKRILYLATLMLFVAIVVPNVAPSLRLERLYNILLILLAPLFALGVKFSVQNIFGSSRKPIYVVFMTALLVPFFLFQTGLVYEVAHDPFPTTPSLSIHRRGDTPYTRAGFVHESDVYSAKWLSKNVNITPGHTYSDSVSEYLVLRSYGMIPYVYIIILYNATVLPPDSYVYLRTYSGSLIMGGGTRATITNSGSPSNTLYSNGNCSILLTLGNSTSIRELISAYGN